ncbi:MAG: hypothetical protein GON13_01180 [Nanoarchaeota archaeon]|nr:hypothetical protein [Nanoarchaeota archaeon]
MTKIKLLTYNIAFGSGRNTGNYFKTTKGWLFPNPKNGEVITKIGELIKKQKPDIVCLQEVNLGSKKNGGVKQDKIIENITGLKKVHSTSNTLFPFYLKLSNLVFTNQKVVKTEKLKLPVIIFSRYSNLITFKINNKEIDLINTHLSTAVNVNLSNKITLSRPWQIKKIINMVNNRKKPLILCGDLNCSDKWKEYKTLRKKTDFQEIKTQNTYPSWDPQHRLDHVLATPEIKLLTTKVLQSNLSDHLPIISELRI